MNQLNHANKSQPIRKQFMLFISIHLHGIHEVVFCYYLTAPKLKNATKGTKVTSQK